MQQKHRSEFVNRRKYKLAAFLSLCLLVPVTPAIARDVTIAGGISTGYEWYERTYDDDGPGAPNSREDDKYSRFRISPMVEITSLSARDKISFSYSPSFRYDFEDSSNDVDHLLIADANRFITQNWRLLLSEQYRRTDEADDNSTDSGSDIQISDDDGRRQYWTNDLSLTSEYTYWEDSLFSLGYTYSIFEDSDSDTNNDNENYDRHSFSASVGHRFDSIWKLTVTGNYVRGLYDDTESPTGGKIDNDLTEYRASTTLESNLVEHHPMSLSYSFYTDDPDDTDDPSTTIHDVTLGWEWSVSKDLVVNLGGGPSYAKTDGEDGEWLFNANLLIQQQIERGSFGLSAEHGFDQENFDGTDQNGLQKYWQTRADFDYQLLKNVSLGLFSSYRYEDLDTEILIPATAGTEIETINKKTFSAGTNLSYMFQQWYTLALSYSYKNQDSEELNDSYDEHRVALTLSYNKDLFHW